MSETRTIRRHGPTLLAVAISAAVSFGTFHLNPDWSLVVGMPGVLWGLYRLRWPAKPLALLANYAFIYLFLIALNGSLAYFDNTGQLQRAGDYHHDYESFNLHPKYRCFVSKTGDVRIHRMQGYRDKCYNLGFLLALKAFGPMDNHFLGKYPTNEETRRCLAQRGQSVRVYHVVAGTADLGFASRVEFKPREHSWSYERHHRHAFSRIADDAIICFAHDGAQTIIVSTGEYAVLFDQLTGKSYARYHFSSPIQVGELERYRRDS